MNKATQKEIKKQILDLASSNRVSEWQNDKHTFGVIDGEVKYLICAKMVIGEK